MKTIPPIGPNQLAEYGRSQRKYLELKKKIKLCQNRKENRVCFAVALLLDSHFLLPGRPSGGGPTLSQTWGTLMISGYMQDSCGIPDMEGYFYQ